MPRPTRVLWVTFDFPPRMSSGVYRPIRIYKYFDRSAYQVDFVTHGASRRFANAVTDDSLLREVAPQPRVYRVPAIIPHDLLPGFVNRLRGLWRAGRRGDAQASSRPTEGTPAPRQGAEQPRGVYRRLAMWLYFPDHLFLWGLLAAVRCLWLHAWHRYDVVYTTSYPESAHLPGLLLHALGVPWVADYRYGGPLWIKKLVGYRKTPEREARDHWFQGLVLRRADRVIVHSQLIGEDFCRAFGVNPDVVHTISNGYDESDFEQHASSPPPFAKRGDEIHLMHVGAMEGVRPAERQQIVDALNRMSDGLAGEGHRLVFHAVGSDALAGEAGTHGIRFEYRRHGVIVHRDLPPYLLAADCFFLTTITAASGNDAIRGFIPGKLFEYLRARRPVLMVGPKDSVWSILAREGVGIDLGVRGEIEVEPRTLIDRVRTPPGDAASVREHSWESRARRVERVFYSVTDTQATT